MAHCPNTMSGPPHGGAGVVRRTPPAQGTPGHLTREKTSHLSSPQTTRLAVVPRSWLCYTVGVNETRWHSNQTPEGGPKSENISTTR